MLQLQQRMESLHRIDKFGESLEHYELGNYEKAAELLGTLLKGGGLTEQEQALVHYRIGLSHSMMQENQLAIKHFRKSFEFSEGVPLGGIPAQVPSEFGLFVITNIASTYLRQGRITDALIYYTYVKEHLDPESSQYPLLLRNIARAEQAKSRYKPPKMGALDRLLDRLVSATQLEMHGSSLHIFRRKSILHRPFRLVLRKYAIDYEQYQTMYAYCSNFINFFHTVSFEFSPDTVTMYIIADADLKEDKILRIINTDRIRATQLPVSLVAPRDEEVYYIRSLDRPLDSADCRKIIESGRMQLTLRRLERVKSKGYREYRSLKTSGSFHIWVTEKTKDALFGGISRKGNHGKIGIYKPSKVPLPLHLIVANHTLTYDFVAATLSTDFGTRYCEREVQEL